MSCLGVILQVRGCDGMSTLQNGAAVSPFRQEFYKMIAVHKQSSNKRQMKSRNMLATYSHLPLILLHPFNGFYSRTFWVSQHQKGKPFWILLEQEMMG